MRQEHRSPWEVIPAAVCLIILANATRADHDMQREGQAFKAGVEAYVYGYPLVLMNVTKRVMTNVPSPIQMAAPVNQFAHVPRSVTMYDRQRFFVANPIDRYVIGDRDRLTFNADGSLDLIHPARFARPRAGIQLASHPGGRDQPDHAALLAQGIDARRLVEDSPGEPCPLTLTRYQRLSTRRTTWGKSDRRR
jgi:Protein of unknown function (DUF1214)